MMAESEEEYLLELWDKNICPNCGKQIPEGTRVGLGEKRKGGFCSLDGVSKYHKAELIERAKKIAALAARHRNS
jgi:hypothetical protein